MRIRPRSVARWLVILFIIAVGVRTGWVLQQFWADPQRLSYPDEEAYRLAGRSLAAGAGLVDEFGYRATYMPAYPAFIAIFESQQASYLFLRLTQAALAALIAPATFLLARAWMESWQRPRRQGEDSVVMEPSQCRRDFVADGDQDVGSTLLCVPVLAGLAAALDPFLIFFSGLLLTEALFVPAFLLTWWLVVRILNSHRSLRPFDAILIGVGIGVGLVACIMLRPSSSIFVALVPILILVYRRFAAIAWLAATLTVFVVVLGLLPWAARNARVLGEWRWTTTRGGISLYDGLQQGTAGESDLAHTKNDSAIRGLSELQWDRYWHDQAVSAFRKEPGRVIKLAGQKFLRTWNIIPNEAEHRRGTAAVVSAVWMTIILLTAAVGAWRYRREVRALFALLVPVLTVTALHMIFVGSVRYRIPVMPMLFVLASVGFCSLLPRQWLLWWALSNGVSGHGASGRQQSSYQLKPSRCLMPLRWLMGRKRRIIVTAILLLMVVIYGSYRYFTAEPRLRRYAQQWLQSATGGEVRIDRVQFELFSGIRLIGVSVATPATADFYPAGTSFDDRTIFKAEHMWLALQLSNMGGDKPIVPEIVAEKPEFLLVRRDDDRRGNWQALQSSQQKKQSSLRLPGIRCRDASVQECRLSEHGRVQERQYRFDADVVALPDQPYIYELNIAAITRDQGSQLQKDQPLHKDQQQQGNQSYRIRFDTRAGTITSLALPRFSLDELQWLAPPELVRWLSAMQSAGTVAADSFRYDPQTGLRVRVAVNDWKLSLPLDEQESADPLLSRFMQFSEVSGTIELDSQQGTVALEGQFHDRPMRIKGAISLPRTDESSTGQTHSSVDWNGVGFDMEATASQVPLPRNDPQTDMAERRFVERFDRVRAFVHDFDSHGPADLTIRLRKNMGLNQPDEFVEGLLVLHGDVSAAFHEFPYRLHEMTGQVRFGRDRRAEIQLVGTHILADVPGTHDQAKVIINGTCGYTSREPVQLEIVGQQVPLNDDLLACMTANDQALCRKFLQRTTLDLNIKLERSAAAADGTKPPWTNRINATFLDGEFNYACFPYVLNQLSGSVQIANGMLRIDELTGRHGTATVRVSGSAHRDQDVVDGAELRLHASSVPLDEALTSALPIRMRTRYEQLAPSGRVDLSGRLSAASANDALQFDLDAQLTDASFAIPSGDGSTRLTHATADLQILPNRLVVRSIRGQLGANRVPSHDTVSLYGTGSAYGAEPPLGTEPSSGMDPSQVHIDGELSLADASHEMTMHVVCPSLLLDDLLRSVFPENVREIYDSASPSGRVRLDLTFSQKQGRAKEDVEISEKSAESGDFQATERKLEEKLEYKAVIEPLGCRFMLAKFPMALENVTGRLEFSPSGLDITRLEASHGKTRIETRGHINGIDDVGGSDILRDPSVHLDMLKVRDLVLNEELRQALPWRLKRMWNDLQPSGQCDLDWRDIIVTRVIGGGRGLDVPGVESWSSIAAAEVGSFSWSGQGTIALKHANLKTGTMLSDAVGTMNGKAAYRDGQLQCDVDLRLQQIQVDGWLLSNASAHMTRSANSEALRISNVTGRFYKGELLGDATIYYGQQLPMYNIGLTVRDVSLQDFLNAKHGPNEPEYQTKGQIKGTLNLAGQLGNAKSHQGSGNVAITDAQIAELPLIFSILQVVNLDTDRRAFQDALLDFSIDGNDVVLDNIDLLGKTLSMVGTGRVQMPSMTLRLILLVGPPMRLPRVPVLTDLLEGIARELMEVHVEGTLYQPTFRADMVRSLRKSIEAMTALRLDRNSLGLPRRLTD